MKLLQYLERTESVKQKSPIYNARQLRNGSRVIRVRIVGGPLKELAKGRTVECIFHHGSTGEVVSVGIDDTYYDTSSNYVERA